MPQFRTQRRARYEALLSHHFLKLEARGLSKLPKATPALRAMIADRDVRWERFGHILRWKVAKGQWRARDWDVKWNKNLSRLYYIRGWRVKEGPKGKQQPMPRGAPNPWAMYRGYVRDTGGDDQNWYPEQKMNKGGGRPPSLVRGLVETIKTEKRVKEGSVSKATLGRWLEQKKQAIQGARGKQRTQLQIEYSRLQRLAAS